MSDLISSGSNGIEKEVEALVQNQKCVVFMGSGLSIPPSAEWSKTVKKFAKDIGVHFHKGKEKEVIDECIEKNNIEFESKFSKEFPKDTATLRTAYVYLFQLNFKAWVTTNFDPWFHNITLGNKIETYKYPYVPMNNGISNGLFYIHGYFDSEGKNCLARDLVFGKKSFDEAYGSSSLLPGFLINLFTCENILFVGFDPTEKYISTIIENSNRIRENLIKKQIRTEISTPKRFIMKEIYTGTDTEKKKEWESKVDSYRSLDIIPFLYDPIDEGRSGLEKKFRNWVERSDRQLTPFKRVFEQ